VNVDRRWLGSSLGRIRVLAAGLVLLGAGCAVLGWNAHSRQTAANLAAQLRATEEPAIESSAIANSAIEGQATMPGFLRSAQGVPDEVSGGRQSRARSLFAGLPLIFEPNQGQANLDPADRRAKFVTRGSGYSLFLGSDGAILSLVSREPSKRGRSRQDGAKPQASLTRVESLEMKLAGANPNLNVTGADRLPGKSNYFLGNDPAKWRHGVPQFARVRYENVYPGINLLFYGNQGRLEYDFQVAPGSDPRQAELEFNGAKKLELNDGALVIHGEDGSVRLGAPRVYQEMGGKRQSVAGSFVLRGANRAGFAIGSYDHARELVIDPILTFSTYFGGSGDEHSTYIAIDGSFNIYLTGSTTSPNLPTATGVKQTALAGAQNVYIAKITPPLGSIAAALDYVTYLGGNGTDSPVGINVDGQGDAFVAGTTSSSNFPTTQFTAYQTAPEAGSTGTSHAFVTELKFDATTLQYSSYLSGNGTDIAGGVTIDASGYMYVTGTTTSTDAASTTDQFPATTLPQKLPYQVTPRGPIQFFVTKVNTAAQGASSIAYSTYFGGATFDTPTPIAVGGGIAVDTNGNMYFTGTTNFIYTGAPGASNSDFPILNPYQPCLDQAPPTTITNPPSCVYTSTTPPTESDAFVAKLNPNANQGEQLIWSTYVGGSGTDSGMGIGLDSGAANVYLVGTTNSIDIGKGTTTAVTSAPLQPCLDNLVDPTTKACTATAGAPSDAFVARLSNPTSTTTTTIPVDVALNYFSYLGGSQNEAGLAITVDNGSGALVTGWTQSADFPVLPNPNSIQSALNGPQDAFVARLNTATLVGQTTAGSWANYFGGSGTDEGTAITLDVNQNAYFAGDTNSVNLQVSKPLQPTNGGGYDAFATQLGTAVSLSLSGTLTLGTNQLFISAGNQATFTYTVTNNGPDLANNITLLDNLSPLITGVPLTFVSASTSAGTCGGGSTNAIVSCSLPSLQAGSTASITIVVAPTPNSSGTSGSFNGGSVQVTGAGNIVLAQTSVPAQMSDFSLLVTPTNGSVPVAGDTASYQIQLTPHPVYGTNIALACTGLPSASACTFTSNPVSLVGPGSSTLNITTTARPVTTPVGSLLTRHFYAIWLLVPGLSFLGFGMGGNRRRKRIAGLLSLCVMFALLLPLPACSGQTTQAPVSGTPPGNSTITVSATSGSDTKSQTITLYVP
jgi:uncharacterized repeat protein (TIGR01451 family)